MTVQSNVSVSLELNIDRCAHFFVVSCEHRCFRLCVLIVVYLPVSDCDLCIFFYDRTHQQPFKMNSIDAYSLRGWQCNGKYTIAGKISVKVTFAAINDGDEIPTSNRTL